MEMIVIEEFSIVIFDIRYNNLLLVYAVIYLIAFFLSLFIYLLLLFLNTLFVTYLIDGQHWGRKFVAHNLVKTFQLSYN